MKATIPHKAVAEQCIHLETEDSPADRIKAYARVAETVRHPFLILDKEMKVVTANTAFYHAFKVLQDEAIGKYIYQLCDNQWDSAQLRNLLGHILPTHRILNNYEVSYNFPGPHTRRLLINARQVGNAHRLTLLGIEDITRNRPQPSSAVCYSAVSCDIVAQMRAAIACNELSLKSQGQSILLQKADTQSRALMDPQIMTMVLGSVLQHAGACSQSAGNITIKIKQHTSSTTIFIQNASVPSRQKPARLVKRLWTRIKKPIPYNNRQLDWASAILTLHGGSIMILSEHHQRDTIIIRTPLLHTGYLASQIATIM